MGGIEIVLLRINNYRKDLNIMYKVDIKKRDVEWNNKVDILKKDYQNSLQQMQFGKFINSNKFYTNNKGENSLELANEKKNITNVEYKNIKMNQNLAMQRERHPIIYFADNGKILFFITKTSKPEQFQKPIKDEMLNSPKEYITALQLIQNKDAYLSNATYVLELKNESELNSVIQNLENDESNLNFFFKDKNLRIYQKEKAFELFYNNVLKEKPKILINNVFEELNINSDVLTNSNGSLIDVTFDKYLDDNIDRISNYNAYLNESWMSYLKLYEIKDNKNDPSDI